ncbi:MAG TPA: thiamine diphosphokinase [Clostridia bacterium]|nr:thiamine diphosphokinase [Clostridia bacterium]
MPEKTCHIIGSGDFAETGLTLGPGDACLVADGGLRYAQALGLPVDLIVGDLDSADPSALETAREARIPLLRLPREKDETDMLAAIRAGLEQGYRRFALYGATGGRLSHTLANLHCLDFLAQQGARGVVYDRAEWITLLRNGTLRFDASMRGVVSVFAYGGDASGVTLMGLKYPLDHVVLTGSFPLGVSNEFLGVPSAVAVERGALLVCAQRQGGSDPPF